MVFEFTDSTFDTCSSYSGGKSFDSDSSDDGYIIGGSSDDYIVGILMDPMTSSGIIVDSKSSMRNLFNTTKRTNMIKRIRQQFTKNGRKI